MREVEEKSKETVHRACQDRIDSIEKHWRNLEDIQMDRVYEEGTYFKEALTGSEIRMQG